MDIVEFAEDCMNANLREWQREHLRNLYKLSKDNDIRVVMPRKAGRRQIYIYMKSKAQKELTQNGSTLNSH